MVGHGAGGGWDTWARMLAPQLKKHTGATVVVRNVPGASGKVAITRMRNKSDGLTIGMMIIRAAEMDQLFQPDKAKYDLREYNPLGIITDNPEVAIISKKNGLNSLEDFMKLEEPKWGMDTPESGKAIRARVLSMVLDKPIKLVTGYGGSSNEILATIKDEVDGSNPGLVAVPYIQSGDVFPLCVFTYSKVRVKILPDVPTIYELNPNMSPKVKDMVDMALGMEPGRGVFLPPGVSQDKVSFMREAFKKALMEPELQAMAVKFGEPVDYKPPEMLAESIKKMLNASKEDLAKLSILIGREP